MLSNNLRISVARAISRNSTATLAANSTYSTSTPTTMSATTPVPSYTVVPKADFGPYSEYSVIHTDRSLNLMSDPFGTVMRDLNALLKHTYAAEKVVIVPGSGTFGMEAVARQFVDIKESSVMVLRNGWFSYRWTEILNMMYEGADGEYPHTVLKAQPATTTTTSGHQQYQPMPVQDVCAMIAQHRPSLFFCPHVETSTGMMLPDSYISTIADAVHAVGGLLVLDCIASGTVWVDMQQTGVDVLISAPQKGWTGPPCAALLMLSEAAANHMTATKESSFSLSVKRWGAIMDTYEKGGFGYHTTMPTDALRDFHEVTVETLHVGLPALKEAQLSLGAQARAILDRKGLVSVAAPGFQAPGVLVYYSPDETANPAMMKAFHQEGLQIAMGVPWKIDEPAGLKTFRIGLFGLDKLQNVERTLNIMERALDNVLEQTSSSHAEDDSLPRARL